MNSRNSLREPPTENSGNETNSLVLAAIGTSFLAVIGCTFPFISMQLRSPLPYMATPRHKVERALKFLVQRQKRGREPTLQCETDRTNTKLRFVDLGSGDGTTLFAAASLNWKSTGIELNPTLWAISSLRRMFQPALIRTNCTCLHGDMFHNLRMKSELNRADCVMIFGVNSLMSRIAELIQNECRRVYVMSYRFRVPLKRDLKENTGSCDNKLRHEGRKTIDALLIYEEEEMRIYELR